MLRVEPLKCIECSKIIPFEVGYDKGLVQMECKVKGFEPFHFETFLSWCSQRCFLQWYNRNFKTKTKKAFNE